MVNSPQSFRVIRSQHNKVAIMARFFDTVVIGLTLWSILDLASVEWDNKHTWWLLISVVGFGFFASFNELYRGSRAMSTYTEVKLIAISWLGVLLVFISFDEAYPLIDPIYKHFFWIWSISVPIEIISWHIIFRSLANAFRKINKNKHKVAIVGGTMLGAELEKIFLEEETLGIDFVGFFDDRKQNRKDSFQFDFTKIVGDSTQLIKFAKEGAIDAVYITLPLRAELRIDRIIEQLSDSTATVHYVLDLFVFDLLSSTLNNIKGIPIVSIHDTPFYGVDGAMKRIFDIVFSIAALMIIALPMLVIALSIRLTSRGPILFKQRRYGFRGEEIIVWKFRSMTVSEDGDKVLQAKKNDPRVTRLGRFLRRTSLDELPQFFNVLQGRMSVVGPRPHAVAHNEFYRDQIRGYMLRHKVKPGITGLAQVNGYRGETESVDDMKGRIENDLNYIRRWSLWLDIRIVLLTVLKGFTGSKAY
jgi:putative colanic acid biosysnthesis UDP-glucose lipid carrier transferase